MKNSLNSAGFPENDRSSGIISSLWMLGGSCGAYLETVFGARASDDLGFELGSAVERAFLGVGTFVIICFGIYKTTCQKSKNNRFLKTMLYFNEVLI